LLRHRLQLPNGDHRRTLHRIQPSPTQHPARERLLVDLRPLVHLPMIADPGPTSRPRHGPSPRRHSFLSYVVSASPTASPTTCQRLQTQPSKGGSNSDPR
jgi:hypothetical protein